jgi:ATP-dependent protease ClpP protease subunit
MEQYHLHLKGYVGGCDFDSDYVDYTLHKREGQPVQVLIDSLGGSLATALSIAAAFRRHGDVTAHFVGMNASAATIASLGARHITIDAHAMYLVHKCATPVCEWEALNADQLEELLTKYTRAKADLEKLDLNVASLYASRCRKERQQLLDLMQQGGWLTATEALEWGFVDEVLPAQDAAPELSEAVALSTAGIPLPYIPPRSLLKRWTALLCSLFNSRESEEHTDRGGATTEDNLQPNNMNSQPTDMPAEELQAALAERQQEVTTLQSRIEQLEAELAALRQQPAEATSTVVEGASHAYHDIVQEAHALYNTLP